MKITVLHYLETGEPADIVVEQVAGALRSGGHDVALLGVHDNIEALVRGLRRQSPDLVFNLLEMFGDDVCADMNVAALLELVGVPYTGSGPGELYLAQDKALAKKILAYEGILYPRFAVFSPDAGFETGGNLRMPLFVKPASTDASIGIDGRSLVHNARELMDRVLAIHDRVGDAALAEEYIEGREFYVGVLGNFGHEEPQTLPVIEMDFSGLPDGAPHVLDQKAKFAEDSAEFKGTHAIIPDLPDELRAKLQKASLDAYRALRVRDYGRVDLRLTDTGDIYVLEVNASCYLEKQSEFATAAQNAGIEYDQLINRIAGLAWSRRRPHARLTTTDEAEAPTQDQSAPPPAE